MNDNDYLFFILLAVGIWFGIAWHTNIKFQELDKRIDRLFENLNGLREYLYEIDPQFDDERKARDAFERGVHPFAGMDDCMLLKKKREDGKRTLNTLFVNIE